MQRIVGIDFGATAIKAVAIESGFRSHVIRDWRAEPMPPEGAEPIPWIDRIKPAMAALAQDNFLVADTVVCSLPGAQVATHLLTLPFHERNKIEATLPSEVEDLIPFQIDDVVFDWHLLTRAPGRTEVLVAVALKRDVRAVLDVLREVGVDPSAVTFSAMALTNLYAESYAVPLEPAEPGAPAVVDAIVDIGAERTNIAIVDGGQFRFARNIAHGGATVTRALARAMEVPVEQAEQVKLTPGPAGTNDPTLTAVVERSLAGLVRELRATFATYTTQSKRKVDRVMLCGGGSLLAGLEPLLADALGVPVAPLSIAEGRTFPEPAEVPRAALALAVALRGTGSSRVIRLDFRRGEFAFTKSAGEMRSIYIRLGAMAASLAFLFGFSMWSKIHALEKREAALDNVLCETTKKILGKCETDFRVALGKLTGATSPAAAIPVADAVDIANALSVAFPSSNDSILSELDIIDDTAMLRGDSKDYGPVEDVVNGLGTNKCFTDIKKDKLTKGKDGKVDFNVQVTYACGKPAGSKKAGS